MPQTDEHTQALTAARIDITRLEVEMTHMKVSIGKLEESVKELVVMMTDTQKTLAEARGGWKTLMMVGGAAGTIGAGISWMMQHVKVGA